MELEKLDLEQHMIKMGMPILQEIMGRDELEAISKITNKNVNETMIVELLINSNGTDLLSDKLLRGYIIHFLPDKYKSYLEFNDSNKKVDISIEKKLINRAWNRKFHSHFRLIEIFGLSNEYLPDEVQEDSGTIYLEPKTNEKPNNFLINLIKKFFYLIKSFFTNKQQETFGLANFQIRIKNELLKSIKKNKLKTIIHMPTGSGKTKTTIASLIDCDLQQNFLKNMGMNGPRRVSNNMENK